MRDVADQYVFAVDGGGSGCRLVVADKNGQHLAEVEGGPANVFTDLDGAIRNVIAAIRQAATQVGLDDQAIASCAAHLGVAGMLRPAQNDAVRAAMPFTRLSISDDRATTLNGALGDTDGIVASVGTGSFVAARRSGQDHFFGGWGAIISDQASGASLGYQLLRQTVLAADGVAAPTALTKEMLAEVDGTPAGLSALAKHATPDAIAALAPKVIRAAKAGDAVGLALMQDGADYLMACFTAAGWTAGTPICLTGGIGPHYASYLSADVQDTLQPPAGTALDGAVSLALQHVTSS